MENLKDLNKKKNIEDNYASGMNTVKQVLKDYPVVKYITIALGSVAIIVLSGKLMKLLSTSILEFKELRTAIRK